MSDKGCCDDCSCTCPIGREAESELTRLRAENRKLREALEKIAGCDTDCEGRFDEPTCSSVAEKALFDVEKMTDENHECKEYQILEPLTNKCKECGRVWTVSAP